MQAIAEAGLPGLKIFYSIDLALIFICQINMNENYNETEIGSCGKIFMQTIKYFFQISKCVC